MQPEPKEVLGMNPWLVRFCELVMQLDRMSRYGRYYRIKTVNGEMVTSPARWSWQRRGRWGMNLLDRLGLLFPYIDHVDPPPALASGDLTDPVDLHEIGADGLPVHMPMPVNAYGEGPAYEDVAVDVICWCDAGADCPAIDSFPKKPE
jgi:hypothetical protein